MEEFFDKPYSELMVWAVLTKRQEMALLMWHHGEEAMAKALVAATLYSAMADEAKDDDLDVEIYDQLTRYAMVFQDHSRFFLDHCYFQDGDLTSQLLTASLTTWCPEFLLVLKLKCCPITKNA